MGRAEPIAAWNSRSFTAEYAAGTSTGIWPDEMHAIADCWSQINGGEVLDLGVGAGRTIPFLSPVAKKYVAIDYSTAMIERCRQAFPGVDSRVGDARSLEYAANSFTCVMFSFNGIDYVDREDRMRILKEIYRVLAPGGAFIFSTHNLRYLRGRVPGFVRPRIAHTVNPARFAIRALKMAGTWTRSYRNYQRLVSQQWMCDDMARVNDGSYECAFLECYVNPQAQIRDLLEVGFDAAIRLYGHDGRETTTETIDPWFYVRALKR